MTFWDIYKLGMLTSLIHVLITIFGDPQETGSNLLRAANLMRSILSDTAAKWATVILIVVMFGIIIILWPITTPLHIWGWFKARKIKKAKAKADEGRLKDF